MKKIKKAFAILLAVYLVLFALANTLYNLCPLIDLGNGERFPLAWKIATHRNGILLFSVDHTEKDGLMICMLNPVNNYGDDWALYINVDWLL